jgi:hypothetical protein
MLSGDLFFFFSSSISGVKRQPHNVKKSHSPQVGRNNYNNSPSLMKTIISQLIEWWKGRPTKSKIEPIDTARLNYLDGFDSINPDPGDNHELLLTKASRLVNNHLDFFQIKVPSSHTPLEIARHLETFNRNTPAGLDD